MIHLCRAFVFCLSLTAPVGLISIAHAQEPLQPASVPPPVPALPSEATALPPIPDSVAPPTPTAQQQAINLPAKDFLEPYIFDSREGRRNPFRPFVIRDAGSDTVNIGPTTPLERFDVDELTLLAVMWDVKTPKAMLMDPLKNIHVVTKDDRIGRKKGYVATIREGEIVIVETSEFNGEPVFSTRVMTLQK